MNRRGFLKAAVSVPVVAALPSLPAPFSAAAESGAAIVARAAAAPTGYVAWKMIHANAVLNAAWQARVIDALAAAAMETDE